MALFTNPHLWRIWDESVYWLNNKTALVQWSSNHQHLKCKKIVNKIFREFISNSNVIYRRFFLFIFSYITNKHVIKIKLYECKIFICFYQLFYFSYLLHYFRSDDVVDATNKWICSWRLGASFETMSINDWRVTTYRLWNQFVRMTCMYALSISDLLAEWYKASEKK